jgi:hypothetical protein
MRRPAVGAAPLSRNQKSSGMIVNGARPGSVIVAVVGDVNRIVTVPSFPLSIGPTYAQEMHCPFAYLNRVPVTVLFASIGPNAKYQIGGPWGV